ncbi:hypothetical protein PSPO_b0281 [Pseudoalteromonas spongiae UST010723-006]|nr:hypothetical protein PSPO_b0281 [Pseudoalteromonas spongiae UST010723-006]
MVLCILIVQMLLVSSYVISPDAQTCYPTLIDILEQQI